MSARPFLIAAIVALSTLLAWLAFFWEPAADGPASGARQHRQSPLGSAPTGGDFTLRDAQGEVRLQDFRGKVVVLYFGYTYCPDVCPTSLSLIAQAFSSLNAAELARVRGIFVSLDPERDSPERLKEYAPFFHSAISGLSGTPDEVAAVARQYGASYMKQKPNADGQYTVDHSSITYVVDTRGQLVASLPHGSTVRQIADAVRQQLALADAK